MFYLWNIMVSMPLIYKLWKTDECVKNFDSGDCVFLALFCEVLGYEGRFYMGRIIGLVVKGIF